MHRLALFSLIALSGLVARAEGDSLEGDFRRPPHAAKPHTWYHMMNGNVTKAGITRDFEALAEAGFGGVQMFDAGCAIPRGGVDFNSPAWYDLFAHAAAEARRLGLEICIPNCSGWSSSGGPWNPPSNGMKRVVFTEARAKGPSRFRAVLPRERNDHGFYADIAVLAFPTPPADRVPYSDVKTTLGAQSFAFAAEKPFTASGMSFRFDFGWLWSGEVTLKVEASDDGRAFREIETFDVILARKGGGDVSLRYHRFPFPVTAKALRTTVVKSPIRLTIKEAHPESRLSLTDLSSKTFAVRRETVPDAFVATAGETVRKEDVRDISGKMSAGGTLDWEVPAGEWTILRLGCVCNGHMNHPASDHGVGLEVDKLSASAMDWHFEQYVARLCRTLGPLAGKVTSGFNNILVDSYEVGSQNWTQGLEREFLRRRGYSLMPYLPVFGGHVVGGVAESERFLEDFRRVVADLFAENYAGALAAKCRQYGLLCSLEPYGNCPADDLQYGQYVDIPMGEFWSNAADPYSPSDENAKHAACIAHVWGKPFCGTESFTAYPSAKTGRWMTTPFGIKAQGDLAFSDGVNRIIYHRFTHQPWADDKYLPGMTMGRWGMHLDRTQTWWPFARPFFLYQARCQALLQRGTFVADALFFAGEQAPNAGSRVGDLRFALPDGYDWDVCPTDAMLALKVEGGQVVVPGGVRYGMLVMPPVEAVTPKMMENVLRLQRAGAKVVWMRRPVRTLGLVGGAAADAEVRQLAEESVAAGALEGTAEQAIDAFGLVPQVTWEKASLPQGVRRVSWIHRFEGAAEWFFVALPTRKPAEVELSFRVRGKVPELWDAEDGTMRFAADWREEGGRTVVRVPFDVCGSKFVVFRPAGAAKDVAPAERPRTAVLTTTVGGPWEVSFPAGFAPNALAKGADEKVTFGRLVSWSERPEEGIRYFSGRATYRKRVVTPTLLKGARLVLALGEVRELAQVTVNGRRFDALWHPPYQLDITSALRPGETTFELEVEVANLWANRLIGDDRLHEPDCEWKPSVNSGVTEYGIKEIPQWVKDGGKSPTGRVTFTTWKHWDKDDELLPSGLLGPVRLRVLVPAR